MDEPLVRRSTDADLAVIREAYVDNVLHGTGTFELDPPDLAEMARRREAVLARGWPWLVVEVAGTALGYAYADQHNARAGYRFYVEDSIYLLPEAQGRGLGTLLLRALIEECEALGARQMLARIGDSANAASIALHSSLGFHEVGRLPSAGWKFGRWCDVVLMQRALGPGDTSSPEA